MGVLLLVRHGQASFGATDYDVLSDLGSRQARLTGERLRTGGADVRRIVSGSLRRQQGTARAVLAGAGLDLPLTVDRRWDEYLSDDIVARATAGREPDDVLDNRAFQALLDDALVRWTGGRCDPEYVESWPAFRARIDAGLQEAVEGPGTTVVVTSAGAVAAVCATLLDLPPSGWAALARVMINASVTKVVVGRSGRSLVTFNDAAHLESIGLITYR